MREAQIKGLLHNVETGGIGEGRIHRTGLQQRDDLRHCGEGRGAQARALQTVACDGAARIEVTQCRGSPPAVGPLACKGGLLHKGAGGAYNAAQVTARGQRAIHHDIGQKAAVVVHKVETALRRINGPERFAQAIPHQREVGGWCALGQQIDGQATAVFGAFGQQGVQPALGVGAQNALLNAGAQRGVRLAPGA